MQSFLPRRVDRGSGPHLFFCLLMAGTLGVFAACSTDDPAPGNAITTENGPDASVRDLPGDGLEPTPVSDVTGPRGQRPNLIEALGSRDPRAPLTDAGPADAGDDASDANGPI